MINDELPFLRIFQLDWSKYTLFGHKVKYFCFQFNSSCESTIHVIMHR
jgi:hypothetical protein